jgi:hypothetical protein
MLLNYVKKNDAVAVALEFEDVSVMNDVVQYGGSHDFAAEGSAPSSKLLSEVKMVDLVS